MEYERRCWAEVDLTALQHNFAVVKKAANNTPVMAVIKANAYGHGDAQVARLFSSCGASSFAVSNLQEAVRLRKSGITQPILLLGYSDVNHVSLLSQYKITQCVPSTQYGIALNKAAAQENLQIDMHIKLDTGMGRLGFIAKDIQSCIDEVKAICQLPQLKAKGIFTHFAVADSQVPEDVDYTNRQFNSFMAVVSGLEKEGISIPMRHCCNSAASFAYPEFNLDTVRAGLILYGYQPSDGAVLEGLLPALQLKAIISHVKEVPIGIDVSYGRTFTTTKPMRIATIAVGYADGYSRALSNCGTVSIHGQAAKVIGKVCMDQILVDVTEIPKVQMGDIATVIGGDIADSIDDVATIRGTINYEVICDIGHRVPRVYVDMGKEISSENYLL